MSSVAQVRAGVLTDSSKPLYPAIEVGSTFWFSWLKEPDVKSFSFECVYGKFTARKEERATSKHEYWYAYRKLAGKLRKVYLGTSEELSNSRLEIVATEIGQPAKDYYYSRKGYTTQQSKSCVTNGKVSVIEHGTSSYPIEEIESCVTDDSHAQELQAEVDRLQLELAATNQKLEISQNQIEQVDNAIGKLANNIRGKQKGYRHNGCSQGIKDAIALAEQRGL